MERRDKVKALLGGEVGSLTLKVAERRETRTCAERLVEGLLFHGDDGEPVPAFFVQPPPDAAAAPAVLCCHAHGARYEIGRKELLEGRASLQSPYAADLIGLGAAVLCLEMPCFGAPATEEESAASKACLWHGRTLFGRMLAEQVAGIDYLSNAPGIDPDRIGTMWFSMGGTHAWWLAALDPRIKAAVSMCCFADLDCLIRTGSHDGHGHYMTVPGLLRTTSTGRLAGLAAPRAHLVCAGMKDWSTPPDCFERARTELTEAYAAKHAQDMLGFHVEPASGHQETPAMRRAVLDFLQRRL